MSDPTVVVETVAPTTVVLEVVSAPEIVLEPTSPATVVVENVGAPTVVLEPPPPSTVVLSAAPQGPAGPAGPQGPPGGHGNAEYTFDQASPLATWTIAHGLGGIPVVSVVDTAGTRIGGFGCSFPDFNTAVLTFNPPLAGTATLVY
jgi:hypothetical protein